MNGARIFEEWIDDLNTEIEKLTSTLAAKDAEIERLKNPRFEEVVALLTNWVRYYPANTIVCSDHPNADPGAKFTHAIRTALALLSNETTNQERG
jgi:hypothetical protein